MVVRFVSERMNKMEISLDSFAALVLSIFAIFTSILIYRWTNQVNTETVRMLAKIENSSDTISKEAFVLLKETVLKNLRSDGVAVEGGNISSQKRIQELEEELAERTAQLQQERINRERISARADKLAEVLFERKYLRSPDSGNPRSQELGGSIKE